MITMLYPSAGELKFQIPTFGRLPAQNSGGGGRGTSPMHSTLKTSFALAPAKFSEQGNYAITYTTSRIAAIRSSRLTASES
jgi:hypothetical protein